MTSWFITEKTEGGYAAVEVDNVVGVTVDYDEYFDRDKDYNKVGAAKLRFEMTLILNSDNTGTDWVTLRYATKEARDEDRVELMQLIFEEI